MSKYRVLDDNKNKYDGEVLTSIVTPETAKGFNVTYETSDVIEGEDSFTQTGTFIFDTFNLNPSGGNYISESDIQLIEYNGSSSYMFRQSIRGGDSFLSWDILFKNISEYFSIRINNINISGIRPYNSSFVHLSNEQGMPEITGADFILAPNESKKFTISADVEVDYGTFGCDCLFRSMNVYRVID